MHMLSPKTFSYKSQKFNSDSDDTGVFTTEKIRKKNIYVIPEIQEFAVYDICGILNVPNMIDWCS